MTENMQADDVQNRQMFFVRCRPRVYAYTLNEKNDLFSLCVALLPHKVGNDSERKVVLL
jgi:hypothetical protein